MNKLVSRLVGWSQAFSVRFKIMGLAAGMVLIMGVSASLLAQSGLMRTSSAELELRGASVASDVAARGADMLLTHNTLGLHELLEDTRRNNPDVRYVVVLDALGRVVSHTFDNGFPADLLDLPLPTRGEGTLVQILNTEEGRLHDVTVPILDGTAGAVRVGMSPQRLRRETVNLAGRLAATVLLVAALALMAAYLLTSFLARPILDLVGVAGAAAAGDLTQRAPPGPPDETGLLVYAFNDMLERLQESQQVKNDLLNRVIIAQEDERRRIARELHDETSQAITSLIVGLRALEEDHPEVRERSAVLRAQAAATLDEIHSLILELRPRALDELGLVPALRRYVADFGHKHGIQAEFQAVGGDGRLPPRIETCLYRIVQEALTNVARHSGARTASVVLDVRPQVVSTIIEDNGRGFDPAEVGARSLGLAGMRERAALLEGSVQIETGPDVGTSVFVKIPLGEE